MEPGRGVFWGSGQGGSAGGGLADPGGPGRGGWPGPGGGAGRPPRKPPTSGPVEPWALENCHPGGSGDPGKPARGGSETPEKSKKMRFFSVSPPGKPENLRKNRFFGVFRPPPFGRPHKKAKNHLGSSNGGCQRGPRHVNFALWSPFLNDFSEMGPVINDSLC